MPAEGCLEFEYRWQNYGLLTIAPATWDSFGGTHDIPKWLDPPADWLGYSGVKNINYRVPSAAELKMI